MGATVPIAPLSIHHFPRHDNRSVSGRPGQATARVDPTPILLIESALEPDEAEVLARLLVKMERGLAELQPVGDEVSRKLRRSGPGQRVELHPLTT